MWRHVGSTRKEGCSQVLAVATDLPLDEKCGDTPLLAPNQRRLKGVVKLDLVAQVVRDEGRDVVDVDRSRRHGRGVRFCAHTPPHNHAKNQKPPSCERR